MGNSVLNIVICGVGGQGTVLAGKLLAACALAEGAFVRSAETIGMAQRGGSVLGHVRISPSEGDGSLASPLVPKGQAQLLIGFEPLETLRAYPFCVPDALVVTATDPLSPPTASLQKLSYDGTAQLAALQKEAAEGRIATLVLIDNDSIMAELGFDRALNVVLLGAALAVLESSSYEAPWLGLEAMQCAIEKTVKKQFVEPNLRALEIGWKYRNP